jgi:hypothetical protein
LSIATTPEILLLLDAPFRPFFRGRERFGVSMKTMSVLMDQRNGKSGKGVKVKKVKIL